MTCKTLESQSHANKKIILNKKKTKEGREKQTLPKFYATTEYTWLCMQETHVLHVTILYNNLRVQGHIRDCAQSNPRVLLKKIQRKKTSTYFWAHYIVNQNQDKKGHTQNQNKNKD